MRSLGLDVGDRRTGVAVSDTGGIIAFSLTTIASGNEDTDIDDIIRIAERYEVERIVVGLPLSLNGELGPQAKKVMSFVQKLSLRIKQGSLSEVEVKMWDERLSTVAAEHMLVESGGAERKLPRGTRKKKPKKNYNSSGKDGIDAVAAAFILQGFLDSQGETGQCQAL
ncbi:MAG: Holliday junction resolvase RuvX [Dehalococcoidia bacterium]|nr:Holliday junction resolvase RuvX [Dehalococcoidia bacterium]